MALWLTMHIHIRNTIVLHEQQQQQVAKVIWHKAALPQQTDGSTAFARLRQYAIP